MSTTSSSEYSDDFMSCSSSPDGSINYRSHTSIQVIDNETETHHTFDVRFYNNKIRTTVTHTASVADEWIQNVFSHHGFVDLVVGLDIEWVRETGQPNKVAVLQLCLGNRCLIYQLFDQLPESLFDFLQHGKIIFVGAGIDQVEDKLWVDYGLDIGRSEDLAELAESKLGRKDLSRAGLKSLMWNVLGEDLPKPREITLSRWDMDFLSDEQVEYACLDAYASFRLGDHLIGFSQKDFKKFGLKTNHTSHSSDDDDGQYQHYDYHRHACITFVDRVTDKRHQHQTFDVVFYNDTIRTTVTHTESVADHWIRNVYANFAREIESNSLIVGLDIEWVRLRETGQRNEVAVLQLCLGHKCLIFQFFGLVGNGKSKKLQKVTVPETLVHFLNNQRITFVGAGIDKDARKLMVDHNLTVARCEDLADLAQYRLGKRDLYRAGLKFLMWEVLGEDLPKPRAITLSRWDDDILSDEQVMSACLDAYASFKLGIELMSLPDPPVNNEVAFSIYPLENLKKSPEATNQEKGVKATEQVLGARKTIEPVKCETNSWILSFSKCFDRIWISCFNCGMADGAENTDLQIDRMISESIM